MFDNFDGQQILPPTPTQLAEQREQARRNQAKFDAERAAKEKASLAAFQKRQVALAEQFKAEIRLKYAVLSDADFNRLWESQLRDQALLSYAEASHSNRIAEYESLMV